MWRIIFIATFPGIISAATRPMEPLEGPLWGQRLAKPLYSTDDFPQLNSELFRQRYLYENARNSDSEETTLLRPSNDKRALAMFARWGSINSIGKNRTPIRSPIAFDSDDSSSAETKGRPLGKPLRWG